jgi:hypothetical protein
MPALAEPGPQPDEPASSDSDEFASGRQAVHSEQLKPENLDAGEHAVRRCCLGVFFPYLADLYSSVTS